jgi:hypothetical protein
MINIFNLYTDYLEVSKLQLAEFENLAHAA